MNKKIHIILFTLIVITLLSCSGKAQVVGPIEEVNGKRFYMHSVEKGQTLYSISKIYKCEVNQITSSNPGADLSIKEGQVLKIPYESSFISKGKFIEKNNQSYKIHEVEKRETLYSISKLYNIEINVLVEANPGSENGVKKGQEILIPIAKKTESTISTNSGLHQHTVVAGETLFALSRQYKVTVEAIKAANPEIGESLSVGQIILIPTKAQPNDHSAAPITETSSSPKTPITIIGGQKKENYTVSLLLPFYSSASDSILTERDKTFRDASLNLYRGIQMASDSLEKKGLKAKINVIDVVDGKSSIKSALSKEDVNKSDLFIGPAFKDAITELTVTSEKTGAHIVIPFPLSNKVLLSSQNMSKACPSEATIWEDLGKEVARNYKADNVILINSTDIEDTRKVQVFAQSYFVEASDSVKILKYSGQGAFSDLAAKLSKSKKNIVIVPSRDKKIISAVFDAIKNSDATVIGLESWENLESISADNRNKFNVSFPNTIYLDYSDVKNTHWIEAYRKRFKTEPTDFSVLGYDLFLFYGEGLLEYGKDFPNHFGDLNVSGLQGTGFEYFRTGNESGFENKFYHLLRTVEFEIEKVK